MATITNCDVGTARGGATPATYDGAATVTLDSSARRVLGLIFVNSFSAYTTDEGGAPVVKISSDSLKQLLGTAYMLCGLPWNSGPATNHASWTRPPEVIPLDLTCSGSEKVQFDLSCTGATQTGTLDSVFGLMYANAMPPSDWQQKFPGVLPSKGAVSNWAPSVTATTETSLSTNLGTSDNRIPSGAKAIVGIRAVIAADTAVTATEELVGYIRLEGSGYNLGAQKWPTNALDPGAGTEVEGGAGAMVPILPAYIEVPGRDIVISAYMNLYGASTGGVAAAAGMYFR